MRKIIWMMSVSLDGFMEGPGHDLGWHLVDDELHLHFNRLLGAMSAFLEGRVTYELMAAFWPTADTDPEASAPVAEFAGIWREMPKIVYSRTLERTDEKAIIVRDVVADEVRALQAEPGGDMALGGADLAATFRRLDLIDVFQLYVHPIVLGQGTPMFKPSEARQSLQLAETRRFGNGVVLLRYERPA